MTTETTDPSGEAWINDMLKVQETKDELKECLGKLWPMVQSHINDHMHPGTSANMAQMWVDRARELLNE